MKLGYFLVLMTILCVVSAGVVRGSVIVSSVFAQSAAISTQDQYTEIRQTYRGQLDEYRTADRQYQITIEQYKQLKTLAALEDAVQQTHLTMKLRNQVLITYLTLLHFQLQNGTGINLDQKALMLQALNADISRLKTFQEKLEPEANRQAIAQIASEFAILAKPLENDAYKVQTLLAVGKLQTVFDKTVTLRGEIDDFTGQKQDINTTQRQRANQEIKDNLLETKVVIDEVVTETARPNTDFSRGSFAGLQDDLAQIYAGLSQSLSFLEELLSI